MSTEALPVELLIEIFELTTSNIGPEVGVSQHTNQSSTMANTSGQVALTESSDENSDDDSDDDERWDEDYVNSVSSDDEFEDCSDGENSDESTQSKELEAKGSSGPGLSEVRRQRDGAGEWSALKTCRL